MTLVIGDRVRNLHNKKLFGAVCHLRQTGKILMVEVCWDGETLLRWFPAEQLQLVAEAKSSGQGT